MWIKIGLKEGDTPKKDNRDSPTSSKNSYSRVTPLNEDNIRSSRSKSKTHTKSLTRAFSVADDRRTYRKRMSMGSLSGLEGPTHQDETFSPAKFSNKRASLGGEREVSIMDHNFQKQTQEVGEDLDRETLTLIERHKKVIWDLENKLKQSMTLNSICVSYFQKMAEDVADLKTFAALTFASFTSTFKEIGDAVAKCLSTIKIDVSWVPPRREKTAESEPLLMREKVEVSEGELGERPQERIERMLKTIFQMKNSLNFLKPSQPILVQPLTTSRH